MTINGLDLLNNVLPVESVPLQQARVGASVVTMVISLNEQLSWYWPQNRNVRYNNDFPVTELRSEYRFRIAHNCIGSYKIENHCVCNFECGPIPSKITVKI